MHPSFEALNCSVCSDFSSLGAFTGNRQKAIVIFLHQSELWLSDPDGIQMERWNSWQSSLWSPTDHSGFWFDWSAVCYWMTLAWGRLKLCFWQSLWVTAELWLLPFNQLHRGGTSGSVCCRAASESSASFTRKFTMIKKNSSGENMSQSCGPLLAALDIKLSSHSSSFQPG